MTNNIVTMRPSRGLKMTPHHEGEAVCLACGHEWVAVAPVSVFELECGECGTLRGVYKYPFVMPSYATYTCTVDGCGCQHVTIEMHKDGGYWIACCKCGHLHSIDDIFGN